ncbi:hypothetical protein TNCV_1667031 [Trichonephila clavipes]|nr:hypothetical protein TNCV_1667031 [Trichonephila clavipes]
MSKFPSLANGRYVSLEKIEQTSTRQISSAEPFESSAEGKDFINVTLESNTRATALLNLGQVTRKTLDPAHFPNFYTTPTEGPPLHGGLNS